MDYRQQGFPEQARDVYWSAISEYGDDAAIHSVEDLFPAISKLYKGDDEQAETWRATSQTALEAEQPGRKRLRCAHLGPRRSRCEDATPHGRNRSRRGAKRLNVQTDNPLLLADCADALLAAGKENEAEKLFAIS